MNRTGDLLAIGNTAAREGASGVSPIHMFGRDSVGAVYLWKRNNASGTWRQRSIVKASNAGNQDFFGRSLAMCGTGHTMAVGADREDSNATGVDGIQNNNWSANSGAVYLY